MSFLFDGLTLGERPSGIRSRLMELLPRLAAGGHEVALALGGRLTEREQALLAGVTLLEFTRDAADGPTKAPYRKRALNAAAKQVQSSWVVSDPIPWLKLRGVRQVGVLHDLRHLNEGESASLRSQVYRVVLAKSLQHVDQVHVVSQTTADRLYVAMGPKPTPVHIVPNGVDLNHALPNTPEEDLGILAKRNLTPGYILCIGHFEARKGYQSALLVREELAKAAQNTPLVMVGMGEGLPEAHMVNLRARFPLQDIGQVFRDVSDLERWALLRHAGIVLCPSLEEGFGLVPLEALACGTPVIARDIKAHREILQDAALFAESDQDFLAHTKALLWGDANRRSLTVRGFEIASQWTWDLSTEAFLRAIAAA